ncbi:MAG TPA: LysR family transcriptional regulator [Dongiaceae bacterium]|nr:LysR family transcriptional regulator [Dongiaceae bacterium]
MKIESLKVFCDLAQTQSFTKAAQINQVTQSAVSQQITSLERLFDSRLVQRGKRKFRLTPQGDILREHSREILDIYEELEAKLKETSAVVSGTIRLATIYSIGLHDLPPYLTKFLKGYPGANVHVEYRHARQIYEDLVSNAADLGMVAYPAPGRNLEVVPLRKDPLALICHPDHPFAKRKSVKLKALDGRKFVGFEPEIPTRKALDRLFKEHRVTVDYVMEFDNVETVKRAVEIDSGLAIVPRSTIRDEVAHQTLAAIRLDEGDFPRPLALIHTRSKVLSPAMKKFIAILKEPLEK